MESDKIIYSRELGINIVNVVFNQVSQMLHIVVATQVKPGEYIGKIVGKPYSVDKEDEAIKIVDILHNKWKENKNRYNITKIASIASKNLCLN